jgi:hypothetical protein
LGGSFFFFDDDAPGSGTFVKGHRLVIMVVLGVGEARLA